MADAKGTRRVYSAEELHSLRNAYSVPRLREAIEEKDGDDADLVKEHVLRGSRSFAARSFRSRPRFDTSRVPSNDENAGHLQDAINNGALIMPASVLGEIAGNHRMIRPLPDKLRPSPTPSIKRKKAEAIVRAHGSPTHVRVTAGGRIVPREQSPLCFPRFGYSAIKANGGLIKFAPNQPVGKATQWSQPSQDGSQNGFVAQDTEGRLCQIVNGTILPLAEVDGALHLYMPAPNLSITQRSSVANTNTRSFTGSALPPSTTQINALELEYSKLEHQLKDLDKTEVIHGKTMSKTAKDALVAKRRELVIDMDKVRKAIKSLKTLPDQSAGIPASQPQSSYARSAQSSASPPPKHLRPHALQHGETVHPGGGEQDHAYTNALYGIPPYMAIGSPFAMAGFPIADNTFVPAPYMLPPQGLLMNPPPFDGMHGWTTGFPSSTAPAQQDKPEPSQDNARTLEHRLPQHDGTASKSDLRSPSSRASHAVPFKDPATKQVVNLRSLLNPKSPIYKPSHDEAAIDVKADSEQTATAPSSASSFRTADFFPNNAREHSLRCHQYPTPNRTSEDKENETPLSPGGFDATKDKLLAGWTATSVPASVSHSPPTVPPGTPADTMDISSSTTAHAGRPVQQPPHALPNCGENDVSPKDKRGWEFVEEHPGLSHNDGNSSEKASNPGNVWQEDKSPQCHFTLDFSKMSREWIQGYQAGLNRRAVPADCAAMFLDGYCSGLLKSSPSGSSDGTPQDSGRSSLQNSDESKIIPPLESSVHSADCLKQAVFSPSNEQAILSPSQQDPSVDETQQNLGAWQKHSEAVMAAGGDGLHGFPFPERGSSLVKPYTLPYGASGLDSSRRIASTNSGFASFSDYPSRVASHAHPLAPSHAEGDYISPLALSKHTANGLDIQDLDGMKSKSRLLYRPFSDSFGHRNTNPLEWRNSVSLAQVANLTPGFFANAQFDGQPSEKDLIGHASNRPPRFKEMSLDGLSPSSSPRKQSVQISPKTSPTLTPGRLRKHREDRGKGQSPTKAKLEHLAGRVAMRLSPEKEMFSEDTSCSPTKHRWRDIWKGARRDAEAS